MLGGKRVAESVKYYEHDDLAYSNRRSEANRKMNTPYDDTYDRSRQPDVVDQLAHNVETATRANASSQRLSLIEKSYLLIIAAMVIGLTVWNLVIQYKDDQLITATFEYQVKTTEIQTHTDLILNELAAKYDYNSIRQVANENGMILQKTQVRNVGE